MNKCFFSLPEQNKAFLKHITNKVSEAVNRSKESIVVTKAFLALMSLLLSFMIWMFVAWDGNSLGTKNITIPVQYTNLSKGYTMNTPTDEIVVKVSDKLTTLSRVKKEDLHAVVDLKGLKIGKYNLPVKIEVYSNSQVVNWTPSTVEVEIYRTIERKIPITWTLTGNPSTGKKVAAVDIVPSEVTISGPEEEVMSVRKINAVIPASKIINTNAFDVPLAYEPDRQSFKSRIKLSNRQVSVKLTLEEEDKSLKVPVLVSLIGVPNENMEISSVTVVPEKVFVHGPSDLVEKVSAINLPAVDVTGLNQDLQLLVPLQAPEQDGSIKIVGPDKARININLRKKVSDKRIKNVELNVLGYTGHERYNVIPSTVQIVVEGPQSEIDKLREGETPFEMYIDVSNIVSNKITLPVLSRKLKNEFTLIRTFPEEVTFSTRN